MKTWGKSSPVDLYVHYRIEDDQQEMALTGDDPRDHKGLALQTSKELFKSNSDLLRQSDEISVLVETNLLTQEGVLQKRSYKLNSNELDSKKDVKHTYVKIVQGLYEERNGKLYVKDTILQSYLIGIYSFAVVPLANLVVKIAFPIVVLPFYSFLSRSNQEYLSIVWHSYIPLKACVGVFATPVIALVGLLIPPLLVYCNRLNGDLELWINSYTDADVLNLNVYSRDKAFVCFIPSQHPETILRERGILLQEDSQTGHEVVHVGGKDCVLSKSAKREVLQKVVCDSIDQPYRVKVDGVDVTADVDATEDEDDMEDVDVTEDVRVTEDVDAMADVDVTD